MLFPRRCAAFIASLAVVSIAPGATFAQSPAPIRIASSAAEAYAQAFFARDQGYFEKAGLNVDVSTLATGNAVSQAVVGGSLDIGAATTINLANAIERGIPLRHDRAWSDDDAEEPERPPMHCERTLHIRLPRISKVTRSPCRHSNKPPTWACASGSPKAAPISRKSKSSKLRSPKWDRASNAAPSPAQRSRSRRRRPR